MHCRYLDTTQNGNHYSFLTPQLVGGRCPFPVNYLRKVTRPRAKLIVQSNQYFICIRQMALRSRYSCLANSIASRPVKNHCQCWQLHNGLFRRRQSHGLSAIAELFDIVFANFGTRTDRRIHKQPENITPLEHHLTTAKHENLTNCGSYQPLDLV